VKRRLFSVLCEVGKMRFGTIDCDDAHCYRKENILSKIQTV